MNSPARSRSRDPEEDFTPAADFDLATVLRPGDHVVVGQACAEPVHLVAKMIELAPKLAPLRVFLGMSLNPAWNRLDCDSLLVTSYCGHGAARGLGQGTLRILPAHFSRLGSMLASGQLECDVVFLQVPPADADGLHSLGLCADYVVDAVRAARAVIIEINPNIPSVRSPHKLRSTDVVVAGHSTQPLPQLLTRPPSETERLVGRTIAELVPDGASVQLGTGGIAAAVAEALRGHRGLRVRSGMVSDWLTDLVKHGAIDTSDPSCCLTGLAMGTEPLYQLLRDSSFTQFVTSARLTDGGDLAGGSLIAVNSAIEVDLRGQVNSEYAGDRYVGAVGGQADYLRAARQTPGGVGIIALASETADGRLGRIVSRISSGVVTTAQSDVDLVVTEYGVADLRAADLTERRRRLIAVAHPDRREDLAHKLGDSEEMK